MSSYVELHCHSAFSLLDGASHPEALVERACTLGYQALALTDRDDLGGIVCFAQAAQNAGIEGIVGAEVTVREAGGGRRGSGVSGRRAESTARPCGFPTPDTLLPTPGRLTHNPPSSPLVLLAEAHEGYANLSTLITRARMDSPRGEPSVSIETLAAHARGLFALTGGPRGWVPRCIARGDLAGARDAAGTLLDIFDGRVAVECWDHRVQEERETVTHLIALAKSLGIPWVVANDVRYATAEERVVHDVLSALRHGKTLDDMGTRLHPNAEWCLKSPAQMLRRWRRHPEGIRATVAIAERCAFRLRELKPSLPAFPLPPGVTPDEYLARLVEQGAYERWGARGASRPDRRAQLAHELAMIRRLHLAGYFLIVWDIVRFAQREGILCQGRGSAANSAVCFCLGITPVDPIKLGLLFERFLSEERQEAPDIDIDFAHRERERVLQYVYERYGRDHAAMVCEQITYRGKSAVRDVARVLGDRDGERGERRKEKGGATSEERTRSRGPVSSLLSPFSSLPLRAPSLEPRIPDLLQQLPRHRSIHVGGFVLTEQPLSTIVPIEPASMENRTVIQWDKDDVDAVGLVKIDLLGLGMLTLIQDCLTYIRATRGHTVDLAELDYADQAVYDDLCRADTIGVFQVESRAQMQTLPRLKPRCFYDLVVEVALIRPGPIQGEMVHPYLRRKNGEEPVEYLHPALEPILARTLGVPLFQEQGMQVAIAAAGFTPGEADTLR
ncbi:MAG TPA: DNA polymerase III subunit alpha, partial [Gemmatimonadaceae bacterium]|nr:DNA polymerase III subunit alpha [Gemmatimonadaceae bacterium]